jgi:hypothetical protein
MRKIVKFNTTIEWDITNQEFTAEEFVAYQNSLLKPQGGDIEDFVSMGVIKRGNWVLETEDAVEDMGEYK